jgi:DNA modification methylase
MKQKLPRYEMHKYWGKKPSKDLKELIEKYSSIGDIVLDPFAGYGVFVCESFLSNRNAIGNDLNPVSNFIQKQLLAENINLKIFEKNISDILEDLKPISDYWYETYCPNCGERAQIISTLRSKDGTPLMNKIKCSCSRRAIESEISSNQKRDLLLKEKTAKQIKHPSSKLIKNGRISAFEGMTTDDLFPTRALQCQSALFEQINRMDTDDIRNLSLFTFTSNLANCSKLVPPIKTRGAMAPGAWMTGFYIGETYIEQNVFHYFKNRVQKTIKGKEDFYQELRKSEIPSISQAVTEDDFKPKHRGYLITNYDAKNLGFKTGSIDYIFTDPPYGDTVPYFEQSSLWNTWLENNVDFTNEIVISDSKQRQKTASSFSIDIEKSISEIYRILKEGGYFSITYHSLSGEEWYALTKACLENGFIMEECSWLTQKTFAPRQLNRKKTVKGDILITLKKPRVKPYLRSLNKQEIETFIINISYQKLREEKLNTNDLYIEILQGIFSNHIIFEKVNFLDVLASSFEIDDEGYWSLK